MRVEAWVTAEPVLNHWVFVCRVIIDNEVQIKLIRSFPVDLFQKAQPFQVGMGLFGSRDNLALQITQSRKERDCAMADVIMGLSAAIAFFERKSSLCALSSAWHWLFSSQQSTKAFSGGSRYSPITSQNFSSKFGSLEILKVSSRCGLMSLWFQMRCTVLLLTPASQAIERILHLTRPCGGLVARSSTREIFSVGSRSLRPLPGASLRPVIPFSSKRFDHLQTAPRLQPSSLATSVSDLPSNRRKIMLARKRSRTDTFEPRTKRPSSASSSLLASS